MKVIALTENYVLTKEEENYYELYRHTESLHCRDNAFLQEIGKFIEQTLEFKPLVEKNIQQFVNVFPEANVVSIKK